MHAILTPDFIADNVAKIIDATQLAAKHGRVEVLKELLNMECVQSNLGFLPRSALLKALKHGHREVVEILFEIELMRELVVSDEEFQEEIRIAAQTGGLEELVKNKLDIDCKEKEEEAEEEEELAIEELFQSEANNSSDNRQLLIAALGNGDYDEVNNLLKQEELEILNNTMNSKQALEVAAINGNLEEVKTLLERRTNEATLLKSITFAIHNGHVNIVKTLLETDILSSKSHNFIIFNGWLMIAAISGQLGVFTTLLNYRDETQNRLWERLLRRFVKPESALINILNTQSFVRAAEKGDLKAVNIFIHSGMFGSNFDTPWKTALKKAIQGRHIKVVKALLSVDVVRNALQGEMAWEFLSVCVANRFPEIVKMLLEIPPVKEAAHILDNSLLCGAVMLGERETATMLLGIAKVREHAAINSNEILKCAAESSNANIDIVRILLNIPAVVDAIDIDNNAVFRLAVTNENRWVTEELLKYPQVRANAAINNNEALRNAIAVGHTFLTNRLLQQSEVLRKLTVEQILLIAVNMPLFNEVRLKTLFKKKAQNNCLSKGMLTEIIEGVNEHHLTAQSLMRDYLKINGYDDVKPHLTAEALNNAIRHSVQSSFTAPFKDPRSHAGTLLQMQANVNALKEEQNIEDNAESAMENRAVLQAKRQFKKVKEQFQEQFEELDLESIEKSLFTFLLERKLAQLKQNPTENAKAISCFERNWSALTSRESKALEEARNFYNANDNTLDMALRSMDYEAPMDPKWEKLFVSPKEEAQSEIVFSTNAATKGSLTLQTATQIAREWLCYAYLVAFDKKLTKEQSETVQEKLIHYMAEINCANNKNKMAKDSFSCFPGTLTRLSLVFQSHPDFSVPIEAINKAPIIVSELVVNAFTQALSELRGEAEKQALYDAITLYSDANAREIIAKPEKVVDSNGNKANLKNLLATKRRFFMTYFGRNAQEGINAVNKQLQERFNVTLDECYQSVIMFALMNMGRAVPEVTTLCLTEAFQRSMPKNEIEKVDELKNPYKITIETVRERLKNFPAADREAKVQKVYQEQTVKSDDFEYFSRKLSSLLQSETVVQEDIVEAIQEQVELRYQSRIENKTVPLYSTGITAIRKQFTP